MKAIFLLLTLIPFFSFAQSMQPKTPDDVVEQIKKHVTCDWMSKTVDVYKAGDPQTSLKGIAVCMFADMPTLEKAVELGCNFIITHEPVFYSHLDGTDNLQDDPVFLAKKEFIEKNKLVIFRFHDHIHMTEPDGIYVGMINQMELQSSSVNGSMTHYQLPRQSVKEYARTLKKQLGLETVRVIGNPNMEFTKMGLAVGAPGGQSHIQLLRQPDVEVLVAGEGPEWETYSYVNDAVSQGKNKAVIFVGHVKSEEAGMKYCAEWLKGFLAEVPIHFIENVPNFSTL
ncbi:Nif3-like dinuclear metal center hexameric protein [Maribellus sp. CM-23]|uniref:Nif3-like dinuclear metal center hexameric protein n=1 Tax=Maribellus sp. CM-23 TaxID=2781026 RepID=UPI001F1E1975|nr:Nif3-like dinuclear metal center hexameric protein [Maribellus sp. CM-23]MCE4563360.1 Nif3-like dinuclear metal center hexameric protein [Maribellus sp. CM-23]